MNFMSVSHARTLYGVGTIRVLRAHWALIELGLDYHCVPVRTRTPDTETPQFKRLNPRQKIPVLRDGDLTIAESAAIVTYLAECNSDPATPLIPTDIKARAKYFEWLSFVCMELDATSLYILRRHEYLPDIYGEAPVAVDSSSAYFTRMINAAALLVKEEQTYLTGEHFTGADILLASCLVWAKDYHQSIPDVLTAYMARMLARPSYSKAEQANRVP